MQTTTAKATRSLVVPNRPPIDKYIGAKRVYLDWKGLTNFQVEFCDVNIPTPVLQKQWDRGNPGSAILIDVGDEKYHKGFMSAAHMQAMKSGTDGSATWNMLEDLARRNNETGFLKNFRHSIAKAVREIPHVLPDDDTHKRIIWVHGMDVVDSFFWPVNRRSWDSLFEDSTYNALLALWKGFSVSEIDVQPFTLPMYFRKMFMSGRTQEEIMCRTSWWLDNMKKVTVRQERARKMRFNPKRIAFHGQTVGLIHIGDYFEAGSFTYQHIGAPNMLAVGIIRNPKGGTTIQASRNHKVNLDRVFQALDRDEPTQWYYEGRFSSGSILMNGSWQFTGVKPTAKSDEQLLTLVQQFAEYEGRK
jgi:hypothetical protein